MGIIIQLIHTILQFTYDYPYISIIILPCIILITSYCYAKIKQLIRSIKDTLYRMEIEEIEKKYKEEEKKYKKKKKEELKRKLEEERYGSLSTNIYENETSIYNEKSRIVGIRKPIGKWTQFIMSQKMNYLKNFQDLFHKRGGKGFWQTLIHAQSKSNSFYKGKGRY